MNCADQYLQVKFFSENGRHVELTFNIIAMYRNNFTFEKCSEGMIVSSYWGKEYCVFSFVYILYYVLVINKLQSKFHNYCKASGGLSSL